MAVRQLGKGDVEGVGRQVLLCLDGLRAADALEVLLDVARMIVRGGAGVEMERTLAGKVQQFGELLTTAEAADYLKARLRSFAPTLETLRTWARPSRRRRYAHLDLPAPERARPHRWRRQDLESWIERRTETATEGLTPALNAAHVRTRQRSCKVGENNSKAMKNAERTVDRAIEAGVAPASARDFLLQSVRNHPGGAEAGLAALERDYLAPALAEQRRRDVELARGDGRARPSDEDEQVH